MRLPTKANRAAETEWDGKQFHVRIEKRDCFRLRVDSLLHEWAHVLSWDDYDTDPHGEKWGLTYSRLYLAWLRWGDEGMVPKSRLSSARI